MREHDVRQRIESFLKRTAREVVIPASVGLGLVLAGCKDVSDAVILYRAPDPHEGVAVDAQTIVPYHPNVPVDTGADVDAGASEAGMDVAVPDVAVDAVTPDADVDEEMTDGGTD